jgi:hypothetical protein
MLHLSVSHEENEMKRQALTTTIGQLRRIADELEKSSKEIYEEHNCDYPTFAATHQVLHQINIVNRKGLSDTWEIKE